MAGRISKQPESFRESIKNFEEARRLEMEEAIAPKQISPDIKEKIREMRDKYGDFICPHCQFYVNKKQTCGWKFSTLMIHSVAKALKERVMANGRPQYCELFRERDKTQDAKSRINWREHIRHIK